MRQVLFVLALLLAGCTVQPLPALDDASTDPNNFSGEAALVRATSLYRTAVAVRATLTAAAEQKTATREGITVQAAQTREAHSQSATGTAISLWVEQQAAAARATVSAQELAQAVARQGATATAEAQAHSLNQTATAISQQQAALASQQTATRERQDLAQAIAQSQATAEAKSAALRQQQAQDDAARSREWGQFTAGLTQTLLGVSTLAGMVIVLCGLGAAFYVGVVSLLNHSNAMTARSRLIETRVGTIMLSRVGDQWVAQLVQQTSFESVADLEAPSQAAVIEQAAPELLPVNSMRGTTFIAKSSPEDERAEGQRKLALRLLRESMVFHVKHGQNARQANRVPSFRDLGWSSETWVRAVSILKPHVIAKQGRGGGTYCGEQYPTLIQLYTALGERRIILGVGADPYPTARALTTGG